MAYPDRLIQHCIKGNSKSKVTRFSWDFIGIVDWLALQYHGKETKNFSDHYQQGWKVKEKQFEFIKVLVDVHLMKFSLSGKIYVLMTI